ncbi:MAG: fluoride efflux transporter CrcB [Chitinophagales bacterium]|jgi:CrcB protein|nr:fluoride efflux transporter CrcB [Bacteroidota bacterium]MBK7568848.1 fluoride efflux transporter CrcB [Bacteroidota bacterium]MBP8915419.1 fluoride efflux transporter CrcB [Chitinophagales bacterium]MBP9220342.1 fluoride efflux transporter CrcB [Chitinophagales bacterium]MBP9794624.1 fluoride efflux transporter CrcB [Chitinophagales bacterium]
MQLVLLIGFAGFLGTIARYLSGQLIYKFLPIAFPFGTLIVNILGCFIIGIVYGWFEKENIYSNEWKLIFATGFCGGFTTFSAFSIENIQLLREGQFGIALLYIFVSVVIGISATFGGVSLMKNI